MAHLFKSDDCGYCKKPIRSQKYYIHHPALCVFLHNDSADQIKQNRDLKLATGILETTVSGGALQNMPIQLIFTTNTHAPCIGPIKINKSGWRVADLLITFSLLST